MGVENNFVELVYMVKFKMRIGNHHLRHGLTIQPKNQIVFGLNGRGSRAKSTTTTESCGSCLPPPLSLIHI